LRKPIPEIADAQALLDEAANAHLSGNRLQAAALIAAADMPAIREWTDSIWGRHNASILRIRKVPDAPPTRPVALRPTPRHPDAALKWRLIARDGYHCCFCGIPVIDRSIRVLLRSEYPEALCWGPRTAIGTRRSSVCGSNTITCCRTGAAARARLKTWLSRARHAISGGWKERLRKSGS
jgi:hypothetical protein